MNSCIQLILSKQSVPQPQRTIRPRPGLLLDSQREEWTVQHPWETSPLTGHLRLEDASETRCLCKGTHTCPAPQDSGLWGQG